MGIDGQWLTDVRLSEHYAYCCTVQHVAAQLTGDILSVVYQHT